MRRKDGGRTGGRGGGRTGSRVVPVVVVSMIDRLWNVALMVVVVWKVVTKCVGSGNNVLIVVTIDVGSQWNSGSCTNS